MNPGPSDYRGRRGEGREGEGERGRGKRERGGEEDTLTTEILCLNQFLPGLLLDFGRNRQCNDNS